MVRGRGYLRGIDDLEQIVLEDGGRTPVLLRDVARVELGPDERRGLAELNGEGEVVGGIVVQRYGENALDVIDGVKAKLEEIAPSLPEGVTIEAVYDRSDLIERAIDTLKRTLIEESIIVALVCIVFLLHVRSALVAIVTLPVGVLMAFIADAAARHQREHHVPGRHRDRDRRDGRRGDRDDRERAQAPRARRRPDAPRVEALIDAAIEVGPALFFSLLIITVSFLPVFTLEAQEGRLFKPLAYTKTFCDGGGRAAVGHAGAGADGAVHPRPDHPPEHRNPLNRFADLALPAGHRAGAARRRR